VSPLPALRPSAANVPQSPKVLVIDDDDGVRKYLAELLELGQLAVVQASTVTEALAAAREHELQLAIIDVVLPDGDGIQLLDGLREIDPLLPMLIVSGQASVESAQRAMQGRAAGMLLKPIAPDAFQQTVERALKDGQVQRLQHKLLLARSEYQPLVLDLPNTERQFAESLAQVYAVFQPLVRTHDQSTYAFEALLRSHGPMSSPADLLEAAEILGRVEELGRQIRGCISRVLAEHPNRFEPIFVNLHPSEFRAELLLRHAQQINRRLHIGNSRPSGALRRRFGKQFHGGGSDDA
jgi:CheY-like chemotaxis protein